MYTVYVCCDIQKIYPLLEATAPLLWKKQWFFPSPGGKHLDMAVVNFGKHHGNSIKGSSFNPKKKVIQKAKNNREGQMKNEGEWKKQWNCVANSLPNNSPWRWDSKCTYIKHPHAYEIIYVLRDYLYILEKNTSWQNLSLLLKQGVIG